VKNKPLIKKNIFRVYLDIPNDQNKIYLTLMMDLHQRLPIGIVITKKMALQPLFFLVKHCNNPDIFKEYIGWHSIGNTQSI
jgi:hypothetical protein